MSEELIWDAESIADIGSRSSRYPASLDVRPEWTQEVMSDLDLVAFEPDPKSRVGAARYIGWSRSAGRVLVIIAYRDLDGDVHRINAGPASWLDLTFDDQGPEHGEDD